MTQHKIDLPCPAKVNLALSLGTPREPGGLHPIASWMVAVQFADRLTLEPADDKSTSDIDFDEGLRDLAIKLEKLERDHRALDQKIIDLQISASDMISLQRLKREKLRMKDEISRLRGLIYPDIIA